MDFVTFFRSLESLGMIDAFLPFLLIFVIFYAVLEKTQVLGTGKQKLNILLSIIISMMVVIPHVTGSYPPGKDIVDIINTALPNISAVFVAIVLALILMNMASNNEQGKFGQTWVPYVALAIVIFFFGSAAGFWRNIFPRHILGQDTISIVMIILIFGLVYWMITKDDTGNGGKKEEKPEGGGHHG